MHLRSHKNLKVILLRRKRLMILNYRNKGHKWISKLTTKIRLSIKTNKTLILSPITCIIPKTPLRTIKQFINHISP